ncbi:pyridoxal phosphate-dependent aminotransferase [Anaerosinus sp.]|uniref:pyridoxal phosphate-dependent aminotransferase n=1 Tax=Selenobaculum sp. TaxID=3074374 RepID=UPI003AB7CCC4
MNKYVEKLEPYKTIAVDYWNENEEAVLKLDWNESTIPPSEAVQKKVCEVLHSRQLNWYPPLKNDELLDKLAVYCNVDKTKIQYFLGSDSAHESIIKAFLNPEENVLLIAPTYDNFRATVESYGGRIKKVFLNEKFELDSYVENNIFNNLSNKEIKIVYICNPNNPTGSIFPIDYIEFLIAEFSDVFFIIDEAYYEFCELSSIKLVEKYKNIIITRTFSKAFSLASFRMGYIISDKENIEFINRVRNPKNIPMISQYAAIAALDDLEYMKKYVSEVRESRDNFIKNINTISTDFLKAINSYSNYVFLIINKEIRNELLKCLIKKKIFVRDYRIPEMENCYIRITIGKKEEMQKVIEVIARFFYERKNSSF